MLATLLLVGIVGVFVARRVAAPLLGLTATASRIAAGEMELQAAMEGSTEAISLATAFNSMTTQLRELIGSLEQRVAERTADLEARSQYLQASAEVGRAAASILDVDQLVQHVVGVIRERLGLYYVALFTVDEAREQAVMRAGTGETGQSRLARGFQLPLAGRPSMIAWSIASGQPRIAQQAQEDEIRLESPELPDTRSEVALPLRSRGQVIGAVSLQSDQPNAFDQAVLTVLQAMADQVAVALDNARLFAESESALEQTRAAYGEVSGRAWGEMVHGGEVTGYRYERGKVALADGPWQPEMIEAVQSGRQIVEGQDEAVVAVPLKVRDQTIGVVNLRRAVGKAWTQEEETLIEALAEQLGQTLESARLYQDTQQRAAREQMVAETTSRMREPLDLENVLQTAAEEMRRALDLDSLAVRLTIPEASGDGVSGGGQ